MTITLKILVVMKSGITNIELAGGANGVAWNVFGTLIKVERWQDSWLPLGMSLFVSDLFIRHMFGEEYQLRLRKRSNLYPCGFTNCVNTPTKLILTQTCICIEIIPIKIGMDLISSAADSTGLDPLVFENRGAF